ncbi:MAG: lytic transglycosylase domain-containing protein [Solirubrobacteraceae bacterium]
MTRHLVTAGAVAGGVLVLGIVILAGLASNNGSGGCGSGPSAVGEPQLIQYDIDAAQAYSLGADGYAYLAAINYVETSFGTDLSTSSAGAVGWMQFEPGTWAEYAVTPSGAPAPDGPAGWNDPGDAIFTAARYLQASGAPGNWSGAIFAYNHAAWYVAEVTGHADSYMGAQGLQTLAAAIDAAYGSGRAVPVALTSTTPIVSGSPATTTVAPPAIDGPTGTSSTSAATTTTTTPGGSGGCGTVDAQGYANPWAQSTGLTAMRIDMGVDYSASGAIDAVGDGTITSAAAQGTGWGPFSCSGGGGGAVVEQLSDGSEKGKWIYIAEGIVPNVSSGTTVMAGERIGTFTGCIEIGWADGPGPAPRAGDLHQDAVSLGLSSDPGAYPTGCGESMNQLLVGTGSVSGLQGSRIDGNGC